MKSKTFWLAGDCRCYNVAAKKMKYDDVGYVWDFVEAFCPRNFEKLTGIKLRPGQQKKVKLVIVK